MAWQIELTASAVRQLGKLDRQSAKRITAFLRERIAPAIDPRQQGKALSGPLGDLWRYRVGDYRVLCDIQDDILRVLVVRIGNRREVYRH
ncbi:MAG: type II toxin-antitoxin system RelE/ParE family toxin [Xanthomonadales bacterium]|nr:type II toxin-antitoxin system RelE/ParE family toxin [Xanthomonadales bacterium]